MTPLVWTLFFVAGSGFFAFQLWGRWKLIRSARIDDGRGHFDRIGARLKNVLVYALGQKKFFGKDQPAGIAHAIIFWGFLVLGLQVTHMFVRGWVPDFYLPFLENVVGLYSMVRDIFEVAVLVAVLLGLYRWNISKPKRLMGILPAEAKLAASSHLEASVILIFIAIIMVTGLFYDATRGLLSGEGSSASIEHSWSGISVYLGQLFHGNLERASLVQQICWWTHNIVILVFLNLLPRSKHFHIITAIPNVFFGKLEPKGWLAKKDYEAEGAIFGRHLPSHFTQKQVLDMYSCTECGRCSAVCPAAATGKPLAPRQMLLDLRDALYARQANPNSQETSVIGNQGVSVSEEVIWSCVACRACEQACPVNIEYVDKIIDMRQHLVQEASRFPEELNRAFKGMETQSNPWGISNDERMAWAQGLDVPTLAENPNPEYLYYVGCGGSFDSKNKKTTASFVKILKQAGVNFAVLGKSELCNGESARRLGNEYLFQTMATALAATINAAGAKKVLVNCPHCFNTLRNEYPEFGGKWTVVHAAALVQDLIDQGKIKFECPSDKKVVYHDSCYYGRFNDIYDEPRNLLKKIPGTTLDEISSCKESATCCGAGGGRMWMEEKKDQRVNILRTTQALESDPQVIATSCPFCKIMIDSAVNEKGLADKVQVRDVMEMVSDSL